MSKQQEVAPEVLKQWIYRDALKVAQSLWDVLSPFCDRIVFAGSIRRHALYVHDIDLVAIPKDPESEPLFAGAEDALVDPLRQFIKGRFDVKKMGPKMIHFISDKGIPIDVYTCTAESFATTHILRTGPTSFNKMLARRAKERGMKLSVSLGGLEIPGQGVSHPMTEEAFFKMLGMLWVPMDERK